MSELTYEEKLQLDNGKEHLKVIQSNLRIASEELSNTLKLTEQAKLALEKSYHDREVVLKLTNETWDKVNTKVKELDNREESLISRENKINEKEKETQDKILNANKSLEDINETARISLSNYLKTIDAQNIVLTNYQNEISLLEREIESYRLEVNKQSKIKADIEKEIAELSEQKDKAEKTLKKFQDESFDEMKKTILMIDKEKEKIKNPLELIRTEQDKLDKLKDDINIIRLRLSQQFKRQNPDTMLPIELQDKKI